MEKLAHKQLGQLWQNVNVSFKVFTKPQPPAREEDVTHLPIIVPKEVTDKKSVHTSRDHDFHRILGITRPASKSGMGKKVDTPTTTAISTTSTTSTTTSTTATTATSATTATTATTVGGSSSKDAPDAPALATDSSVGACMGSGRGGRGGRGGGRGIAKVRRKATVARVSAECKGDVKPISLVKDLHMLCRSDVFSKRIHKPSGVIPHIIVGERNVSANMAAQMNRSLEYAKRHQRPQIICDAVDEYRLFVR